LQEMEDAKIKLSTWSGMLDSLASGKFEEMELMQTQYDRESRNGNDATKQKKWRTGINLMLQLKSPLYKKEAVNRA